MFRAPATDTGILRPKTVAKEKTHALPQTSKFRALGDPEHPGTRFDARTPVRRRPAGTSIGGLHRRSASGCSVVPVRRLSKCPARWHY